VLLSALGHEKNPLAVLVSGSYAQGRAEGDSDLDLVVLTQLEPVVSYRTWFVERSGRPLHVSAAFETMTCWLARREEPAGWSLGLPTATPTPYLWKTAAAVEVLGDEPKLRRPRAEPELEDFVEAAIKVRRAVREGAYARARWHAHLMAELAPRLLLSLNPERRVVHVWDAVQAALDLPIAPVHYREDMNACLGLSTVSDERIAEAGLRLPCEMLAFLRQHDPDVDPQPWLSQYLRDGTLQRLLED
jgi:phosphoribosyl-AMP cyclohydrolase